MNSNISSSNTAVQSISVLPTTSLPSKDKSNGNISFMFYVMKAMQDTLKSDKDCLERQIKEKLAKEAIEKVLLTIHGLSNKKAFLKSLLKMGISDSDVKSYVSGLLEGIEQDQAKEKELEKKEKQAKAKLAADKDLTKYPAYEEKYKFDADLKEEKEDFKSKTAKGILKGLWNIVDSKTLRDILGKRACKKAETILKNPTAKKDIGKLVNSSYIKDIFGLNDNDKNSKTKGLIGQFLSSQLIKNSFISEAFQASFEYKNQMNKWIDKEELHFSGRLNDLAEKIGKDTSKRQAWTTYGFKVPAEILLDVFATVDDMIFSVDGKAFHHMTGDSNYKISPDKKSEKNWQKQTNAFEENTQNFTDLIVKEDENNINFNMQKNKETTNSLEQTIQGLNIYSDMLDQLALSNKV